MTIRWHRCITRFDGFRWGMGRRAYDGRAVPRGGRGGAAFDGEHVARQRGHDRQHRPNWRNGNGALPRILDIVILSGDVVVVISLQWVHWVGHLKKKIHRSINRFFEQFKGCQINDKNQAIRRISGACDNSFELERKYIENSFWPKKMPE